MKHKPTTIEFVQKTFKRGSNKGTTYWSVARNTTVWALAQSLGKEIVQSMLVKFIDIKMIHATTRLEATEQFAGLKTVHKDFQTADLRKQLDQAIRNNNMKLARKLFKQLT